MAKSAENPTLFLDAQVVHRQIYEVESMLTCVIGPSVASICKISKNLAKSRGALDARKN